MMFPCINEKNEWAGADADGAATILYVSFIK